MTTIVGGTQGITVADLYRIAGAARDVFAVRAAVTDPREWSCPERARAYARAMTGGRVWVACGGVHASVPGPSWRYAAGEVLDQAVNDALTDYGACMIAEREGYSSLYFGGAAAQELGYVHRAAGQAPFGDLADAGSAALMNHLGETGPTTAGNHGYRAALCEAYADALAGPAPVTADAGMAS